MKVLAKGLIWGWGLWWTFTAAGAGLPVTDPVRDTAVDFQKEVLPFLKKNCLACHNQTRAKAGLVLETPQTITKGGDSGEVVIPGNPDESFLFQVAAHREDPIMPPSGNKSAAVDLSDVELGLLKRWIAEGAQGEVTRKEGIEWKVLPQGLNPIYTVGVTADGKFAACGRGNQVAIYDLVSGEVFDHLWDPELKAEGLYGDVPVAHRDFVHSMAFSPDGQWLATGGFEVVKLWHKEPNPRKLSLKGHGARSALSVSGSADGRYLASGGADGLIRIWDQDTGQFLSEWPAHEGAITGLSFSRDGRWLASVGRDGVIGIWVASGPGLYARTPTETEFTSVAWSGDEPVTGGRDGNLTVWRLPKVLLGRMEAVRTMKAHEGAVQSVVTWESGQSRVISGGDDGKIREWDLTEGKALREMNAEGSVIRLAVRPDGKRLASSVPGGGTRLWNLEEGKVLAELKGDPVVDQLIASAERALEVAKGDLEYRKQQLKDAEKENTEVDQRVTKAGEALEKAKAEFGEKDTAYQAKQSALEESEKGWNEFVALRDGMSQRYSEAEKALNEAKAALASLLGQNELPADEVTSKLNSVVEAAQRLGRFLPEYEPFQSSAGEREKALKGALDEARKQRNQALKEKEKTEETLSSAENESELAARAKKEAVSALTAAQDAVPIAETQIGQKNQDVEVLRQVLSDRQQTVHGLAFSPDNRYLATGGESERVYLWSAEEGRAIDQFEGQSGTLFDLCFLGDGMVVSAGLDPEVVVWKVGNGWELTHALRDNGQGVNLMDRINALAFSPDGQWLVTGDGEPTRGGHLNVWEVESGKWVRGLRDVHSDVILDISVSPDGQWIASSSADKFVKVHSVVSLDRYRAFEGHTHYVMSVGWKGDSRTLVSAGADQVLKVWDLVSGKRNKDITGFGKEVTSVSVVGVGNQAVAGGGDSKVKLVNFEGKEIRNFSGAKDFVHSVASTPDGRWVIAGGEEGVLYIWDGQTGKESQALR